MPVADQSTEYDDLLDALATACQFGSGLNASKIVEWYEDSRPLVEGAQCVGIWIKGWEPTLYPGAGREGYLTYLSIQITLWTRFMGGKASVDKWRFRNANVGHLVRMRGLLNYLVGENLFTSYNATTYAPTGDPLNWEPLQHLPGPFVERVDIDDESWIRTPLKFQTLIAQPLDV